jgi:hypothetical protein
VHWSIFNVSVANLVLIAVMVVIFGVALVLPFPHGHIAEPATADDVGDPAAEPEPSVPAGPDGRMWTARLRRRTAG